MSNASGKTWLVTGGAGFIGSHLVDALLARGDRVRVLDDLSTGRHLSPAAEFVRGSVTDPVAVAAAIAGVAGVFHLAAIASVARCADDWAATHAINQGGTVQVLEAARNAGGVPVVYASSAAVYGPSPAPVARESDRAAPCSPYGCDKLGSESHASVATNLFGVPSVGLRFFNVYGPRQNGSSPYSGVISIFAERLRRGEPLLLNGGGAQTRDFVFVSDVVAVLGAAMERVRHLPPVLNVCTGESVTVHRVASLLAQLSNRAPRFETVPVKPGDILHSRGDPALLRENLGVAPKISINEGLRLLLGSGRAVGPEARVA